MAFRLLGATSCLILCLVLSINMSSLTEGRRALNWPPKRDRETVSWPMGYGNKPRVVGVSSNEDDDDEPSCAELRAIWRLSKRAARESLFSNKIPPAHVAPDGGPLFGYMVRTPQIAVPNKKPPMPVPPQQRNRPKQSFGRMVVDPARSRPSGYGNGFDQVANEMRNAGVFDEKPVRPAYGMVAYPTAVAPPAPRPAAYYGKNRAAYKNYVYTTATQPPLPANRYKSQGTWGVYKNPAIHNPNSVVAYSSANRKAHLKSKQNSKKYGHYLEPVTPRTGFSTDTSGCHDIDVKHCQGNQDCSCYGLYSCIKGRCRTTSSPGNLATPAWRDDDIWHEGPLPSSDLGLKTPSPATAARHLKHWKQPVANSYNTDHFGTWS